MGLVANLMMKVELGSCIFVKVQVLSLLLVSALKTKAVPIRIYEENEKIIVKYERLSFKPPLENIPLIG